LERRSVPRSAPTSEELESRFAVLKRHLTARQVQLAEKAKSVSSEEESTSSEASESSVERPVAVKVLDKNPKSGPEGLPQKAKDNTSGPTDLSQAASSTNDTSCKAKGKGQTKKVGQGTRKRRRLAASSA
jgi:hypothetical protein